MDLESMMGLDKPKTRPKKARSAAKKPKAKGLLRSLRGSKKKSVENLLAGEKEQPRGEHLPRRAQSGSAAERKQQKTSGVRESIERRHSTVKKVTTKSSVAPGADPVLASGEGVVASMRRDVAALAPCWPTAALKRALDTQRELLHFESTSLCSTGDAIKGYEASHPCTHTPTHLHTVWFRICTYTCTPHLIVQAHTCELAEGAHTPHTPPTPHTPNTPDTSHSSPNCMCPFSRSPSSWCCQRGAADVVRLVAYAMTTQDSLARSAADSGPDLNPYRSSTVPKGPADEVQRKWPFAASICFPTGH